MSKEVKQSGPTTRYGRQIVYDREIFISICTRLLRGEDLDTICAKPPMPIGPVFLAWVEDYPEARAIYRDRKSTRLNSSHLVISYAVFCLKKKKKSNITSLFIKKKNHLYLKI